jgi:hypothetical protein
MKTSLTFYDVTSEEAKKLLSLAEKLGVSSSDEEETEAAEEETEETEEEQDEKPAAKGKKAKGATVEDVIAALQEYAEEHDRKAAMKFLTKFKVKSVHDLDEADYPKILKLIKA